MTKYRWNRCFAVPSSPYEGSSPGVTSSPAVQEACSTAHLREKPAAFKAFPPGFHESWIPWKERELRSCRSALPACESYFWLVDRGLKIWASFRGGQQTSLSHFEVFLKSANSSEAFNPLTRPCKGPPCIPSSRLQSGHFQSTFPTSLNDHTEVSRQDRDSGSCFFFYKMGRLGTPYCMSSAQEEFSR